MENAGWKTDIRAIEKLVFKYTVYPYLHSKKTRLAIWDQLREDISHINQK